MYTGNFRGINYVEDFKPDSCTANTTQAAAVIAAAENDRAVYKELASHDAIVVGGSAETVGIVGWFTGGGTLSLSHVIYSVIYSV